MPLDTALSDRLLRCAIKHARQRLQRPIVVGLAGCQGSGKSTMAGRLAVGLDEAGLSVVVRSIDDFYLTRKDRQVLAGDIHPLLATRGVPGTHDVELAYRTIRALTSATDNDTVALPTFDKAIDDRIEPAEWPVHVGRVDVVILEGWCVGAKPQSVSDLDVALNDLERDDDPTARWRRFVNDRLASSYAELFSLLDLRVLLKAPSFAVVRRWRGEQERKLDRSNPLSRAPMTDQELDRFISSYERISRWMLDEQPAEIVLHLNEARALCSWTLTPFAGGASTATSRFEDAKKS